MYNLNETDYSYPCMHGENICSKEKTNLAENDQNGKESSTKELF